MSGFKKAHPLTYYPVTPTLYTVAAGAAGWVDTDIAELPDDARIACMTITTGNQVSTVGVRKVGSTVDTSWSLQDPGNAAGQGTFRLAECGTNGHLELYRNAAFNAYYSIVGYMK